MDESVLESVNALNVDGVPKFFANYNDENGRTYRNMMYVTATNVCPNKCGFCRNNSLDFGKKKKLVDKKLVDNVRLISSYIYTMTFGGGEPLLVLPEISEIVIDWNFSAVERYLVTSGLRKEFFKNEDYLRMFHGVNLSRHKADDLANQESFGTKKELLTIEDISKKIYRPIREHMTVMTTCHKDVGVENSDEMIDFVSRMNFAGLNNVLFNDLQKDATGDKYFENHNVSSDEFDRTRNKLTRLGLEKDKEIVFSGGYTIDTLSNGLITVGFKHYHESEDETKKLWKNAKKRSYDFSASPNGDLFTGLKNAQRVNISNLGHNVDDREIDVMRYAAVRVI